MEKRREYQVDLRPLLSLLQRYAEPVLSAAAGACGASGLDRMLLLAATSLMRPGRQASSSASPKSCTTLLLLAVATR